MTTKTIKRVKGDTFILCTFSFGYGPMVCASGNSAEDLMKEIVEHIDDDDTLCLCRVGHWTVEADGDPTDFTPRDLKTICQITPFEIDALDEEEEGE